MYKLLSSCIDIEDALYRTYTQNSCNIFYISIIRFSRNFHSSSIH